MADENAHQVSTRDSSDPHKVYPDRSVLGGEVGLWSSDLNALPAPRAREAASEIEELVRRSPGKGGLHQRLVAPLRDEPPRGGDRHSQHLRP
jgi:hypothetical protein